MMRSNWLLLLCLLFAIAPGLGAAEESARLQGTPESQGWTVEQVVAALNSAREPSVSFEETTYSSLLSAPLVVRGLLHFTPPATLEKEVLEPYHERYVIEGDLVTFESERKRVKKSISLGDYPGLRGFVEAFRAGFTGDAAQLTQIYETALDGTRLKWTLRLRPRDPAGRSMVEDIVFSGSEGRISAIVIHAADGDRSVMTLRRGAAK
ncbi:MAG: outer membrane lipoprotein carrier protein LolA [Nitrospira sp.]|nr:outer membrane lipoprotein carrier protein LolA [Nitrospira sp.]